MNNRVNHLIRWTVYTSEREPSFQRQFKIRTLLQPNRQVNHRVRILHQFFRPYDPARDFRLSLPGFYHLAILKRFVIFSRLCRRESIHHPDREITVVIRHVPGNPHPDRQHGILGREHRERDISRIHVFISLRITIPGGRRFLHHKINATLPLVSHHLCLTSVQPRCQTNDQYRYISSFHNLIRLIRYSTPRLSFSS